VLIVEIQSPSTERDDYFVKLPHYQSLPSLEEILYVESQLVAATLYRRAGNVWETIVLDGGDALLQLETIGLDVPLSSLYRGVPGL
jgi:Uma2 family endonuclease